MQHISGTVTADATIKQLEDGRKFITFSIADYDSYKPKDSNERVDLTTFFNCTYWIGTGVAKVLRKGAVVDLIGRAWAKPYQDRNDKWNAALNFNASEIRFSHYAPKDEGQAESGTQAKATGKSSKAKKEEDKKDDLPF
jgi:single-strand DNA-binding protein